MTELALSSDLNVITAEINSYKQVAGQSIFEIGKRLKHVRDSKMAEGRGGWSEWLLGSVGFSDRQARRLIQVSEEFNTDAVVRFGSSKIFELLQLPDSINKQEFIEQKHVVPSTGQEKSVDEMTRDELREVKKALKEQQTLAHQAKAEAERWKKAAQQAQNMPPRIDDFWM